MQKNQKQTDKTPTRETTAHVNIYNHNQQIFWSKTVKQRTPEGEQNSRG